MFKMTPLLIVSILIGVLLLSVGGYMLYEKRKSRSGSKSVSATKSSSSSETKSEDAGCGCASLSDYTTCNNCEEYYPNWRIAEGPISLRDETTDIPWEKGSCDRVDWDLQRQADFYGATCNTTCY